MTLDENGQAMAYNFGVLGLGVDFIRGFESPLGITFLFNLKNIADYNENKIKNIIKKQSVQAHLDMSFEPSKETHFGVFVKRNEQPLVYLPNMLSKAWNDKKMYIGVDDKNELVDFDFDKATHLLIAGTTGSGKTNLLKNLITNILVWSTSVERKRVIYLIDTKYELNVFSKLTSTFICVNQVDTAIEKLNELCDLMDSIYEGKIDKEKIGDIYIVVDELADLMLRSKFEVEESIVRLAQKGRAIGIHLIIATQRPTIDVCSGLIKANMPNRIALKVASVRDSVVILDHKGAEQLNGNGDCIVKVGLEEKHCQIAYSDLETINKILGTLK